MSSLKEKIELVSKQTEENSKSSTNHTKYIGEIKTDIKELKKELSVVTSQLSQLVNLTVGSLESVGKTK